MKTGLAALGVIAAAGISIARQPGSLQHVYAEDGTVFLADAANLSTLDALTQPYAGYLHTVPRLLAELMPLEFASIGLAVAAALVTGLMALLVYVASGDHLHEPLQRLLVSAVVVLVPVAQDELPNTIANLHWPALYLLFWLLIWEPKTPWLKAIVTFLITASDILTVVFIPLLLWKRKRVRQVAPGGVAPDLVYKGRTRRPGAPCPEPPDGRATDKVTFVAFGAGLAAQAAAVLFGPDGRELALDPVRWAPWYAIRALPPSLFGERFFGSDVDTQWLLLAALAWVLVAAVVLWTWKTGPGAPSRGAPDLEHKGRTRRPGAPCPEPLEDRKLAGLAALYSVALYALPVVLSGQATPRYAAAPAMLLVVVLVALMKGRTWMLACYLTLVWAVSFHVPSARDDGPQWNPGCGQVPISPQGWTMEIKCPA